MVAAAAAAQTPAPTPVTASAPLFIKGNISITYQTRQTTPTATNGVKDTYVVDVNVSNRALLHGTIVDTPQIIDGWVSKKVVQKRSLRYDIACDIVNPNKPDPKDSRNVLNVGKMYGTVPINSDGVYDYDAGNLVTDILPIRGGAGFSSKFSGIAAGKPLIRPKNWLETLQRQAINVTRSVNGKRVTVVLKKYDKMEFRQHVIGAGPSTSYPSIKLNGEMLYDYDKSCWFLNNITGEYAVADTIKFDRLTGLIRWIESPERATNGEGEYQFDIRVNEPAVTASSAFEAQASSTDDSAFFESDSALPSVNGTMKYKDRLDKNGTTLSSAVTIELAGSNITQQQLMNIGKMVIFSAVVPMNSD